jgi:hypothetical protein
MPIIEGFDHDSILSVNHPGIVAVAFDTLGIAGIKDLAILKNPSPQPEPLHGEQL